MKFKMTTREKRVTAKEARLILVEPVVVLEQLVVESYSRSRRRRSIR